MRTIVVFALLLFIASCGGRKDVSVPRPYAWPRIEVYTDSMVPVAGLPIRWMANYSAQSEIKSLLSGSAWADIRYPAYHATLFLTFICDTSDALDSVMANRRSRIAVNLGDTPATFEEVVSSDRQFRSELITATGLTPSPLQFVSRGEHAVVAGTLFFDIPPVAYDSVRPVIDALHIEIVRALKSMEYETDI